MYRQVRYFVTYIKIKIVLETESKILILIKISYIIKFIYRV